MGREAAEPRPPSERSVEESYTLHPTPAGRSWQPFLTVSAGKDVVIAMPVIAEDGRVGRQHVAAKSQDSTLLGDVAKALEQHARDTLLLPHLANHDGLTDFMLFTPMPGSIITGTTPAL